MSGIIIGAILTFLTGLALWRIQRERLSVHYELFESDIFPRERGIGRFFVLKLRNDGNKPVQKLETKITFQAGKIESIRLGDSSLVENAVTSTNEWSGTIILLNPKESFEITVTAEGSSTITTPTISSRTLGVTATPRDSETRGTSELTVAVVIIVWGSFLICGLWHLAKTYLPPPAQSVDQITSLGTNLNQKVEVVEQKLNEQLQTLEEANKRLEEENKQELLGKPDTEEILFSTFNNAGLGYLFPKFIKSGEVSLLCRNLLIFGASVKG